MKKIDLIIPPSIKNQLPQKGVLKISKNKLIYLDVADDYIHRLFPLLKERGVRKPNYFSGDGIGAHISVFYPEEQITISQAELDQTYLFTLRESVMAEIAGKEYYVILVEAPGLIELRKRYQMPASLCFKGYAIDLHITVAVK